jgi:hypothetical protein
LILDIPITNVIFERLQNVPRESAPDSSALVTHLVTSVGFFDQIIVIDH